jgi:hypothetical protein
LLACPSLFGVPCALDIVENVTMLATLSMTTMMNFGTTASVGGAKSDSE